MNVLSLETRKCAGCEATFRVLPSSTQEYHREECEWMHKYNGAYRVYKTQVPGAVSLEIINKNFKLEVK